MTDEAKAKRARPSRKQRQRMTRQRIADRDRDAGMLPIEGPIADLVAAISAELARHVAAGLGPVEATDRLRPFGEQALKLTDSARGVRAVSQKAIALDPRHEALRRSMLNKAWNGIGDQADASAA